MDRSVYFAGPQFNSGGMKSSKKTSIKSSKTGSIKSSVKSNSKSMGTLKRLFSGEDAASLTKEEQKEEESMTAADAQTTGEDMSHQAAKEPAGYQNRRGTFMNHTPRDFEIQPRKTETQQTFYDEDTQNNSFQDSPCRGKGRNSSDILRGELKHESYSSGATGTSSSRILSGTTARAASNAANGQRSGHYSPLEPLVAQHRREATGSDVDTLPPSVDVDKISQTSAMFAVQEYFKDLQMSGSVTQTVENGHSLQTNNIPNVPDRNPSRLNGPLTPRHAHVASTVSDFTSAACGQYSPYDDEYVLPRTPHKHKGMYETNGEDSRPGSPIDGPIAPPIPSHAELTSRNTPLSDLNYYLRNTGPKSPVAPKEKEKKIWGFGKARHKNTLAAKVGSVEGSPATSGQSLSSVLPRCAREMTTSNGAKHRAIVLPQSPLSSNPPLVDSGGLLKGASNGFSDETLSPLVNPVVEKTQKVPKFSSMDGADDDTPQNSPISSNTVIRSPKKAAVSPKATPVKDHPLLTSREEQTRQRKLRDRQQSLQKSKKKPSIAMPVSPTREEDTVAGASPTSPTPFESEEQAYEEVAEVTEKMHLRAELARLQTLNDELVEELAIWAGADLRDSNLSSYDVLTLARQRRAGNPYLG